MRYHIPESHFQNDKEEIKFNSYLKSDSKVATVPIPVGIHLLAHPVINALSHLYLTLLGTAKRVSKMMITVQKVDPDDNNDQVKRNQSSSSLKALLQQQQEHPLATSPSTSILRTLTLDHFLSEHKQLYQNVKKINSVTPSVTRPTTADARISVSRDDTVIDSNEVSKRLQLIHKEAIKKRVAIEKTIEILQAKGWNMI